MYFYVFEENPSAHFLDEFCWSCVEMRKLWCINHSNSGKTVHIICGLAYNESITLD